MGITDFVNPNDVAEKTVSEVRTKMQCNFPMCIYVFRCIYICGWQPSSPTMTHACTRRPGHQGDDRRRRRRLLLRVHRFSFSHGGSIPKLTIGTGHTNGPAARLRCEHTHYSLAVAGQLASPTVESCCAGLGEDGRPRRRRQRGADQRAVVRHHAGAVGHRLALRRDQAQGRHPHAGAEVPGQGDPITVSQMLQDL